MSATVQPQPEPGLATYGAELARSIFQQMNCHALGFVDTFDPIRQAARARIGYKKQLPDGSVKDYPLLVDCPVVFLGGGTGRLTFPLAPGDDCMVLFNDRNMDHWIVTGQAALPDTGRMHAFSDAIILPGVRPFCRALPAFFATGVELAYGTTTLQLSDKFHMATATTDLLTLLNTLVDRISTIVGQLTPTTGMTAANIAANQAALATFKTSLGGLLR